MVSKLHGQRSSFRTTANHRARSLDGRPRWIQWLATLGKRSIRFPVGSFPLLLAALFSLDCFRNAEAAVVPVATILLPTDRFQPIRGSFRWNRKRLQRKRALSQLRLMRSSRATFPPEQMIETYILRRLARMSKTKERMRRRASRSDNQRTRR